MVVRKLTSCDAFVVADLDGATSHVGIVRLAPKILVDGATTLARSLTYLYASFGQQVGGASAGINAKPEGRAEAIAAFVAELEPDVTSGALALQAGKGLGDDELAPLAGSRALDPASSRALLGTSVVAAAGAVRSLEGARVAVDGLDAGTASVLPALAAQGAVLVAVATADGSIEDPAGLDAAAVERAVLSQGAAGVRELGPEPAPAGTVFAVDADVLLAGSKVGAIDHGVAAAVRAPLVVPIAPVPVTAKALATLRRAGTVVLPDFLSAAGPWFATFPSAPGSVEELAPAVAEHVANAVREVLGHDDGPLLAACYRAETFLRTWQESLPFGRPLA